MIKIISIRQKRDYAQRAISYFQKHWANKNTMQVYDDCITHTQGSEDLLPQWYLLMNDDEILGCAGLVTNDFISRMDLYPWLCALYIEEKHRGNEFGKLLIEKAKEDASSAGFKYLYLNTDHDGFYEKYGFEHIGKGYHPWGETSKIYRSENLQVKVLDKE